MSNFLRKSRNFIFTGYYAEKKKLSLHLSAKLIDSSKVMFIHVPKAAGISFHNVIYGSDSHGHLSIQDYTEYFGKKKMNDFYKFSIVRNPYTRLFSAYNYLKKGGRGSKTDIVDAKILSDFDSFEVFVLNYFYQQNNIQHFLPQTYWLKDLEGEIIIDHIGYFENLEDEFQFLKRTLNINQNTMLPKKNRNEEKFDKPIFSKEMLEIVNDVYKEDFKILKYKPIF